VDSQAATVTVNQPPSIAAQPQGQVICSGSTATLSVVATGTAPLHYQWYEGSSGDTSNPVGSDSSSFTTAALSSSASYWVRVTNSCGSVDSETVLVTVSQPFPFLDDFSTDKGWTGYEPGGWERGFAIVGGGENGYPAPSEDHSATDDNFILGFGIGADYSNNLTEEVSIVSPPIDCTGQDQVFLKFWRYLNVGASIYDKAGIYVSNDGLNWEQIWENPDFRSLTDNRWIQAIYDISPVAADQERVYVKFSMGPTNEKARYSGWNIDDFEITSEPGGYAISGFIRDKYGNAIEGVEVCFKDRGGNDMMDCVESDAEGFYIQYGFESYSKYKKNTITVVPYDPDFKFSPKKKSIKIKGSDVTINFKAKPLR